MKIPLARYWKLLSKYIKDQRSLYNLSIFLLICSIGFKLLGPQITRAFIDSAESGAELNALLILAAVFIGAAVLQQVLSVGAVWSGELVAWSATNQLRIDLAHHCLDLDMSFHKNKTPGEMIQRLDEDISAMAIFFSQLVVVVGGNLLLVLGIVVMFYLENVFLGIIFTVFAPGSILLLNKLREVALPLEVQRRQAMADLQGYLEERLSGTEDVRSCGGVGYVINGLYRLHANLYDRWKRVQFRYWLLGSISMVITIVGYIIALAAGLFLFEAELISLGSVFLIFFYMNLLSVPLAEIASQVQGLQEVGASLQRITELQEYKSGIESGSESIDDFGALSLEFNQVNFSYQANRAVLKDISFRLEPGHVVGILGETGSGKTTLSQLIFRLYDTDSGSISLSNQNIRDLKIDSLRNMVAMVTQEVQLFQATVRDNLTFFRHDVDDEKIIKTLHQLELGEWIDRLPLGLDTRIETGGRSMSAGEAQLLAFARAFLKDPGLVILDEASSRLDSVTEQKIERAMDTLLQGRSAIVIAHRLHTVQRADDILILDNGKVVEYGKRVNLINDKNSRFSKLFNIGLEEMMI